MKNAPTPLPICLPGLILVARWVVCATRLPSKLRKLLELISILNSSITAGRTHCPINILMETISQQAGFNIIHTDNNVTDAELNFDGPASSQILRNWKARCERLVMLRKTFPDHYTEICADIIAGLQSHKHTKANNVRFVVARK